VKAIEPLDRSRNLSPRELECLAWAAQGKTYTEIGALTNLRFGSVKTYLDSARLKLNAVNLVHAVALAISYGTLFMTQETLAAREADADRYYGEVWVRRQQSTPLP
jgi:DNA-binding CsgD family transcriptional regulator